MLLFAFFERRSGPVSAKSALALMVFIKKERRFMLWLMIRFVVPVLLMPILSRNGLRGAGPQSRKFWLLAPWLILVRLRLTKADANSGQIAVSYSILE